MIDIAGLRILAEEYRELLEALRADEAHTANRQEIAYGRLKKAYGKIRDEYSESKDGTCESGWDTKRDLIMNELDRVRAEYKKIKPFATETLWKPTVISKAVG